MLRPPPLRIRCRMRFRTLLFLLLAAAVARATTVQPPTFSELVDEADGIYRGRVTTVLARRVATPEGASIIKTFVTFAVERTIKGSARPDIVLEFLGGTIGDESLEVGGTPHFDVGDREILFVQQNGVQFCPLVRLGHGRYRVERDATTRADYVARDDGAPLTATDEVALPLGHDAAPQGPARAAAPRDASLALSPDAFETRIRGEIQRARPREQLP